MAQSDVDKTNQSYYGESKLYYITTDGKYEGLVPLRKFLMLFKELMICSRKSTSRLTNFLFLNIRQGKRGLFMKLSGHIQA